MKTIGKSNKDVACEFFWVFVTGHVVKEQIIWILVLVLMPLLPWDSCPKAREIAELTESEKCFAPSS